MNAQANGAYPLRTWLLIMSMAGWQFLFALPAVFHMDSRIFSVPFRAGLLLLTILVLFAPRVRPLTAMGPAIYVFGLFWTLYIARLAIDATINQSAMRLMPAEYFAYAIGTGMLPALALGARLPERLLRKCLFWIITLCGMGGLAVVWLVGREVNADLSSLIRFRSEISAIDTISIGHLGTTVTLLCAYVALRRQEFTPRARLAAILLAFVGLLNVGVGSSKGPIIALVACVPFLFHLAFTRYQRVTLRAVGLLTVISGGVALLIYFGANLAVVIRFTSALSGADAGSIDVRLDLIRQAWSAFLSDPILGAGTEPLGFYPHNLVVEAFAAVGLFGGIAYLALTFLSLAAAIRLILQRTYGAWLGLLLIQYSVGDLFSGSLYMSPTSWALKLVVIAYAVEPPRPLPRPAPALPPFAALPSRA